MEQKVGSNAVVVRDIPEGATAVGIPARILDEEKKQNRSRSQKIWDFSAYAIAGDLDDPMVKAVHGLIDNAAKHEEKIRAIMEVLESQFRSSIEL